ncbi:MAG: ATP-dependent helicase HrpB [Candidatus Aminicenantes bacterium]|jgi:ATP-dependent helicase HrpB
MKEFGQYPIDPYLQGIAESLHKGSTCLIKAEPGAGKTTRVPLYLLSIIKGKILVLEPRRLAARLSALRSAWFLDEICGKQVGFRIRQDSQVSGETRLTFITEGIFVRLLRDNPTLNGVGAVVLDEFHERNIHTDIALVLVRQLQQTRRWDLKLIVMSATLDTTALEKYLENAAVFDIKGKVFPVELEYVSGQISDGYKEKKRESQVTTAVNRMLKDPRCPGNILVFLTGIGEIMRAKQRLEREIPEDEALILPLAADLPLQEQQRVFQEQGQRKIILSTNVAETSVTIPGVTGVIDPGFAKIPAHAPWSGMPTLEIKRIGQASAIQRAGRAGRTQNGVVYRLYSKTEFLNRDQFTPPDIQRIDISHALLEVMNLGYSPELMPWFDPPEEKNVESAVQLLTYLGAIGSSGELTGLGKKLSQLPLHPRLAALVAAGLEMGGGEDALLAACLISEGFVLKQDVISISSREDEEGEPCDLSMQMDLIKASLHKNSRISPYSFRFLETRKQKQVLALYRTLARIYRLPHIPPPGKTNHQKLSRCLFRGYPDRVARKRDINHKRKKKRTPVLYNFCLGRGGMIGPGSFLFNKKPEFLIAIDAVENLKSDAAKGIVIRVCTTLEPEILKEDPAGMIKKERREEFQQEKGTISVWQDLYYGRLKVESQQVGVIEEGSGLAQTLAENWPYPFDNDDPLKAYHKRVELLNQYEIPHNCPIFTGEMLELFFESICAGIDSLKELKKKPLEEYIYDQLGESDKQVLAAYVPTEIKLKNGKRVKVHYEEGKEPWAEILIQHCYGLKETPSVMLGKHRLILHLQGPNHRVAQVTDDLAGFWQGSYNEVRKELSRRYPKHYWPENPSRAEPETLKRFVK